jgi:hypothetical protein
LSALARYKIICISSMADDKTFEIRDVVSSESRIVSINSLFRFSSISLFSVWQGLPSSTTFQRSTVVALRMLLMYCI